MTVSKIRQAIQKTLEKDFFAVWRVLDLGCDLKGIVRLIFYKDYSNIDDDWMIFKCINCFVVIFCFSVSWANYKEIKH